MPFIIEDTHKAFYYRGLSNYEKKERQWLIDTCLTMQDKFRDTVEKKFIPEMINE